MRISASSHAKLFVDLNPFGLFSVFGLSLFDYHELQTEKKGREREEAGSFLAHYYKMFCLHFSKMVAQKMTSHTHTHTSIRKGKNKGFGLL